LLKRFQIKADFRRSYQDLFLEASQPKGFKRAWTEVGGALLFVNHTTSRNIHVALSSSTFYSGSYKTTNTKSISVSVTIRRQIGLRAGFLNISSPLSLRHSANNAKGENLLYSTYNKDTACWFRH